MLRTVVALCDGRFPLADRFTHLGAMAGWVVDDGVMLVFGVAGDVA